MTISLTHPITRPIQDTQLSPSNSNVTLAKHNKTYQAESNLTSVAESNQNWSNQIQLRLSYSLYQINWVNVCNNSLACYQLILLEKVYNDISIQQKSFRIYIERLKV